MKLSAALFLAVLLCTPAASAAPQDTTLGHCLARAHNALHIARYLDMGLAPERIHLIGRNDEESAWIAALKAEVMGVYTALPASPGRAARTAQKVAETCAHELGRMRVRHGAIAGPLVLAGSGGPAIACHKKLADHRIIAGFLSAEGNTKDALIEIALQQEFPQERLAHVMRVIKEAPERDALREWYVRLLQACMLEQGSE